MTAAASAGKQGPCSHISPLTPFNLRTFRDANKACIWNKARHSCLKARWPHGWSGQPCGPRAAPVQSKLALPSVWGFYECESSRFCHVQKDWDCLPITWREAYAYEGSRSRDSERMTSRGGGLAGAGRSDTGDLSGCEAELTAQRCPWPPADAGDEQPCSRTGPSVVRETPPRGGGVGQPHTLGAPGPPEPLRGQ